MSVGVGATIIRSVASIYDFAAQSMLHALAKNPTDNTSYNSISS